MQNFVKIPKLHQKNAFSRNQFLYKGIDSLKQKTYRATPRILLRTSNKCILTFRGRRTPHTNNSLDEVILFV